MQHLDCPSRTPRETFEADKTSGGPGRFFGKLKIGRLTVGERHDLVLVIFGVLDD